MNGSARHRQTIELLARHADAWTLRHLRWALEVTHRQYRDQGSALTHGAIVAHLARSVGHRRRAARELAAVVDVLHFAVDLADNIADAEEDAAAGRDYAHDYAGIPYPTLVCLPTFAVCAALTVLAALSPAPSQALAKVTRQLGRMTHGQGLAEGHRARPSLVSGAFGALYALPLWMLANESRRARIVETWGIKLALHGHRRIAAAERPSASTRRAAARAEAELLASWPRFSPFRPGERLSQHLVTTAPGLKVATPMP